MQRLLVGLGEHLCVQVVGDPEPGFAEGFVEDFDEQVRTLHLD